MTIDNKFFEDEIRDGFFVPSEMKHSWAAQLVVYSVVKDICLKHNLKFYAAFGTMLGAVRHGGFIPWDDDMDLFMFRHDYELLIKALKTDLPRGYSFAEEREEEGFIQGHIVIANVSKDITAQEGLVNSLGFIYQAGIDIFPLDYLPVDEDEKKWFREINIMLLTLIQHYDQLSDAEIEETRQGLIKNYNLTFNDEVSFKAQLISLSENVQAMYDYSEQVACIAFWLGKEKNYYNTADFASAYEVGFENITVPVPAGYDNILRGYYGDYTVKKRGTAAHAYPYYFKHREKQNINTLKHLYFTYNEELLDNYKEQRLRNMKINIGSNKKVVFAVSKAEHLSVLNEIIHSAQDDNDWTVSIVGIPYYQLNGLERWGASEISAPVYDEELLRLLNELGGTTDYRLEQELPDLIIHTHPYDEWNPAITVPDYWKIPNMFSHCQRLVYVPGFVTEEYAEDDVTANTMSEYYVYTPGVMYSDKVVVQSENIKQLYLRTIEKKTGREVAAQTEDHILAMNGSVWNEIKKDL